MTRPARRLTRRRRALPAAAIAVALTFGLAACGAPSEEAAASMHTSVVQVAERAAAGDFAGALAELALLDREVAAAFDAGRIDAAREQEIRVAMDLVRADLEAAIAAATTPTQAPADGDDEGDGDGNNGNGNGNNGNGNGNGGDGNNGNGNGNGGNEETGTDEGDDGSETGTEPPTTDTPSTETPGATPPATDGSGDG